MVLNEGVCCFQTFTQSLTHNLKSCRGWSQAQTQVIRQASPYSLSVTLSACCSVCLFVLVVLSVFTSFFIHSFGHSVYIFFALVVTLSACPVCLI